jgi:aspartate dehydrogenase
MSAPSRRSVALVGFGALGAQIARGIVSGTAGDYRLGAVLVRSRSSSADAAMRQAGARCCTDLTELIETRPDYVIEAASADALRQIAVPCLRAGAHLVVLSTGAFADAEFFDAVISAARQYDRRIHVASGAIGGLDLVQSAMVAGETAARITTEKPPAALKGAPGLAQREPSTTEPHDVFRGSAREAIARFPQNVNVAVTLALAAAGLDRTMVAVRSNPALSRNRHSIELEGAFGHARIEVEASPSPDNPRSSALAGYSVLALLRRLASPLQL